MPILETAKYPVVGWKAGYATQVLWLERQLCHHYPECTARARARGEVSWPGRCLSMLEGGMAQLLWFRCNGLPPHLRDLEQCECSIATSRVGPRE